MVSDAFEEDWTKFSTFRDGDPKNITYLEYARLVAHRSKCVLDNLIIHSHPKKTGYGFWVWVSYPYPKPIPKTRIWWVSYPDPYP
jgi:hypothetical protein